MRVRCPTCGREGEWDAANPWRPFCCERCKLIDLGAWLTEEHAIPGEPAVDITEADLADAPPHRH